MLEGFIYEWYDKDTGLKYIGRHEGSVWQDVKFKRRSIVMH
jgi:hypothetical protein